MSHYLVIYLGQLFFPPDDGHGVEGVGFLGGAFHHGGDVLFLDGPFALDLGGDVHGGVHILDGLDEGFCLFGVVLALDADGVRELGEFLVDLLAVRVEDARRGRGAG